MPGCADILLAEKPSRISVAAMGKTLITNTHRQPIVSTMIPPRVGPARNATVVPAVQRPMARPRATPSKLEVINASELGTSSAPAIPCSPRARMSISGLTATAQSNDATPNPTRPIRRMTILPRTSESDPASRMSGPEGDEIRIDDPLLGGQSAAEIARDRGKGDVDDTAVEERNERGEDRDPENQSPSARDVARFRVPSLHSSSVAQAGVTRP